MTTARSKGRSTHDEDHMAMLDFGFPSLPGPDKHRGWPGCWTSLDLILQGPWRPPCLPQSTVFHYVFGPTAASRCFQDLQVRTGACQHRPLLLTGACHSHSLAAVHIPWRKEMTYKQHLIMPLVTKGTPVWCSCPLGILRLQQTRDFYIIASQPFSQLWLISQDANGTPWELVREDLA